MQVSAGQRMRSLYVTHYGILEPLGQSQILPYQRGLAGLGVSIDILSFEKQRYFDDNPAVTALRADLAARGIRWHPQLYRSGRTTAGLLRALSGASLEILRLCRRSRPDLIHCRSHVTCVMAAPAALLLGIPILFDFRGFAAEESVDSGLWKEGDIRFRAVKSVERAIMRRCGALIVLTEAARRHFLSNGNITADRVFVIPCCVDLDRFQPQPARVVDPSDLNVVYSGSVIGRYDLAGMLRFFGLLRQRRPGAVMTILASAAESVVAPAVIAAGLPSESVRVLSVPHSEVPGILADQDLGLTFTRGGLALIATSPTKTGEYLASGVPQVSSRGLGDMEDLLEGNGVGLLIDLDDTASWQRLAEASLEMATMPGIRERCRRTAEETYDLRRGVETYRRAYDCAVERVRRRHQTG